MPKLDDTLETGNHCGVNSNKLIDVDIPAVTKFTYLTFVLHGEAWQVIQGWSITEKNYGIACELLQQRYCCPERIIFSHIHALLSLHVSEVLLLHQLQDTMDTLITCA